MVCEREHEVQIPKGTKESIVPHAKSPISLLGLRQKLALQSFMSPLNIFHSHHDLQLDDCD